MRSFLSPAAINMREEIDELNNLIAEAFFELGELHQELAQDPNNEHIKAAIEMIRDINREQIREAKRLEDSFVSY